MDRRSIFTTYKSQEPIDVSLHWALRPNSEKGIDVLGSFDALASIQASRKISAEELREKSVNVNSLYDCPIQSKSESISPMASSLVTHSQNWLIHSNARFFETLYTKITLIIPSFFLANVANEKDVEEPGDTSAIAVGVDEPSPTTQQLFESTTPHDSTWSQCVSAPQIVTRCHNTVPITTGDRRARRSPHGAQEVSRRRKPLWRKTKT